ncbi:hypothetical protein [Kaistella polysaccharea]|nr:hypothetical protein [Kaistella polysaccharea]
MKNLLLVLLLIIAIAMIVLGIKGKILPPTLTGIGFIIIGVLFYQKKI